MRRSETNVQFSIETPLEYWRNEYRRAKGKIFSYIWNRYQWKNWPRKKVPKFPLNIDIEVSSRCQIDCDHCFRQYMDIGEDGFMPFEMYKRIVAEAGRYGLFTLKFSMRGEPLMHPDIIEMVKFAKKSGIKEVWINTNGGLLTERLIRGLLTAGVDWITVSFDGLGEYYEAVRKPLKYEDQLEKLKLLRRIRDELGANTFLNVQSIWSAIKHNPEEYISLMKSIVDRVAYNPDMNYEECTLIPDDSFVCPRLWQRIAITSSGDYLKCPSDFKKQEILGNVNTCCVKEAWDVLQEKQRQLHLKGLKSESRVCNECHHGAKKITSNRKISGKHRYDDANYEYTRKFSGYGLNKSSLIEKDNK